jgi:lipopolysaccharide/colanic/teichoic acid biosynthesis glycosyltransferase
MRRALNVSIAALAALLALPVGLTAAVLIKLEDGGPVFFRQERVGLRGLAFRIFKFRTMIVDADRRGLGLNIATDDDRITRTGRVLRRWSLDEIPQLLNVMKGDMNVVGPRPALPMQVARYTARERRRLEVRPGLTGWAQVNGRNALTWAQRIDADLWYVDHASLSLDLRILMRTPAAVLRSEGLYEREAGLGDEFNVFDDRPENEESAR